MNKKKILLGVVLLIAGQLLAAQTLRLITLRADGTEQAYGVSNAQKIVFENSAMTVQMKEGADVTDVKCISFGFGQDYSGLRFNEVSGVGEDCEKFYELINIGTRNISLEGCRIYYQANGSTGGVVPVMSLTDNYLTWTGHESQVAMAGELFTLIGRIGSDCGDPYSFESGLTAQRILRITLTDPLGNVIDQCIRTEDTGEFDFGSSKSFSRIPDGTGYFYFTDPTPDALNGNNVADLVMLPNQPEPPPPPTGFSNPKAASSIYIFPNPVENYLNVAGVEKGAKINLLNLNGALLQSIIAEGNNTDIDVSSLPKGIYLLQIGEQGIKFIKK